MVHLGQMRHFMGGDIVEDLARCHDQPPGKHQPPFRGARPPARARVAQRQLGIAAAQPRRIEVAALCQPVAGQRGQPGADLRRGWLPQVCAALAAVDGLEPAAERILGGHSGRLELSFVSTADYSILPRLVHRFRELYPEVELALNEATSDRQIAELAEGKGQAGIVIRQGVGVLPAGFGYRRLLAEPLIAAVPELWIDEGRLVPESGRIPAEAVIAAPLILFPRRAAPVFHDLVTGYYSDCGGEARVAQHAIQMQTIISLVSAGMGIALVPIVGKPMAQLLTNASATVTLAHSRTKDLPEVVRRADIVVAAVGRPEMVKGDWIKPGATVIDVGINRIDAPELGEGKARLVGDVDFAEAKEVAGAITPVPGGVGPMTIACLLANTVTATCQANGLAVPPVLTV